MKDQKQCRHQEHFHQCLIKVVHIQTSHTEVSSTVAESAKTEGSTSCIESSEGGCYWHFRNRKCWLRPLALLKTRLQFIHVVVDKQTFEVGVSRSGGWSCSSTKGDEICSEMLNDWISNIIQSKINFQKKHRNLFKT